MARVLGIDVLARAGRWAEAIAESEQLPALPQGHWSSHAKLLRDIESGAFNGGDLGYIGLSSLPTAIGDALQASTQNGLFGPFATAQGYEIMLLEDRKVKHEFQALARSGKAKILTKHVVKPTQAEIQLNGASRSAKLRALERV